MPRQSRSSRRNSSQVSPTTASRPRRLGAAEGAWAAARGVLYRHCVATPRPIREVRRNHGETPGTDLLILESALALRDDGETAVVENMLGEHRLTSGLTPHADGLRPPTVAADSDSDYLPSSEDGHRPPRQRRGRSPDHRTHEESCVSVASTDSAPPTIGYFVEQALLSSESTDSTPPSVPRAPTEHQVYYAVFNDESTSSSDSVEGRSNGSLSSSNEVPTSGTAGVVPQPLAGNDGRRRRESTGSSGYATLNSADDQYDGGASPSSRAGATLHLGSSSGASERAQREDNATTSTPTNISSDGLIRNFIIGGRASTRSSSCHAFPAGSRRSDGYNLFYEGASLTTRAASTRISSASVVAEGTANEGNAASTSPSCSSLETACTRSSIVQLSPDFNGRQDAPNDAAVGLSTSPSFSRDGKACTKSTVVQVQRKNLTGRQDASNDSALQSPRTEREGDTEFLSWPGPVAHEVEQGRPVESPSVAPSSTPRPPGLPTAVHSECALPVSPLESPTPVLSDAKNKGKAIRARNETRDSLQSFDRNSIPEGEVRAVVAVDNAARTASTTLQGPPSGSSGKSGLFTTSSQAILMNHINTVSGEENPGESTVDSEQEEGSTQTNVSNSKGSQPQDRNSSTLVDDPNVSKNNTIANGTENPVISVSVGEKSNTSKSVLVSSLASNSAGLHYSSSQKSLQGGDFLTLVGVNSVSMVTVTNGRGNLKVFDTVGESGNTSNVTLPSALASNSASHHGTMSPLAAPSPCPSLRPIDSTNIAGFIDNGGDAVESPTIGQGQGEFAMTNPSGNEAQASAVASCSHKEETRGTLGSQHLGNRSRTSTSSFPEALPTLNWEWTPPQPLESSQLLDTTHVGDPHATDGHVENSSDVVTQQPSMLDSVGEGSPRSPEVLVPPMTPEYPSDEGGCDGDESSL